MVLPVELLKYFLDSWLHCFFNLQIVDFLKAKECELFKKFFGRKWKFLKLKIHDITLYTTISFPGIDMLWRDKIDDSLKVLDDLLIDVQFGCTKISDE